MRAGKSLFKYYYYINYFFGILKGISEESDDAENHFIVFDVVDVVGIGIATVNIEDCHPPIILFDAFIEPSDEIVGDLDISFLVLDILVTIRANTSLLL
jgi:hypothetical protein